MYVRYYARTILVNDENTVFRPSVKCDGQMAKISKVSDPRCPAKQIKSPGNVLKTINSYGGKNDNKTTCYHME